MRKVISSTFMSLDGVIAEPQLWSFDFRNEELDRLAHELLSASDAMLMGRRTYEIFAASWPGRTGDFADRFNSMNKYVVSSSLDHAAWNNSTIIKRENAVAEVARLKQQPGQNIIMYGFGPVAQTLTQHDLLDEVVLWVHPIFVGRANPDDLLVQKDFGAKLNLMEARPYSTGVVILTYQPQSKDRAPRSSEA